MYITDNVYLIYIREKEREKKEKEQHARYIDIDEEEASDLCDRELI